MPQVLSPNEIKQLKAIIDGEALPKNKTSQQSNGPLSPEEIEAISKIAREQPAQSGTNQQTAKGNTNVSKQSDEPLSDAEIAALLAGVK